MFGWKLLRGKGHACLLFTLWASIEEVCIPIFLTPCRANVLRMRTRSFSVPSLPLRWVQPRTFTPGWKVLGTTKDLRVEGLWYNQRCSWYNTCAALSQLCLCLRAAEAIIAGVEWRSMHADPGGNRSNLTDFSEALLFFGQRRWQRHASRTMTKRRKDDATTAVKSGHGG